MFNYALNYFNRENIILDAVECLQLLLKYYEKLQKSDYRYFRIY